MPDSWLHINGITALPGLAQAEAGRSLEAAGGFGWLLLKTALVLLAVCALAYLAIRFGLARLTSRSVGPSRRLVVLERLSLDPRRSLQIVRVGDRVLLIGVGEGGIGLLTELAPEEWLDAEEEVARGAFKRALQRALGGSAETSAEAAEEPVESGAATEGAP